MPTIGDRVPEVTEAQRAAARRRLEEDVERESLTEAATRAIRASDCGCEEPGDYLTRDLESSFRCPHAVVRGRGPSRGRQS